MISIRPRDIKTAALAHWPIKLTALALAAMLWAVTEAEEPTTQLVPVNLVVSPPAGRALSFRTPPVQALYAGPARELIKLFASPPLIDVTIPDTISAADYILTLTTRDLVVGGDVNVQAQDVQPRTIRIVLDDLARKTVPVVPIVRIIPDSGYTMFSDVAVIPATIEITGPEAIVSQIDTLHTFATELTRVTAPIRRRVRIDTTSLGVLQLSQRSVIVLAEVGRISERVIMGVPVRIRGRRSSTWVASPPAVVVTLRGPASRLAVLTRDSIELIATPPPAGDSTTAAISVSRPVGVEVFPTPGSVIVRLRGSG